MRQYPGICLKELRKTTENRSENCRISDRDFNPGPPEHKAGKITIQLRRSDNIYKKWLSSNIWGATVVDENRFHEELMDIRHTLHSLIQIYIIMVLPTDRRFYSRFPEYTHTYAVYPPNIGRFPGQANVSTSFPSYRKRNREEFLMHCNTVLCEDENVTDNL